jgi:hypothetical protein
VGVVVHERGHYRPGGVNQAKVDAKNNLNTAIHDAGTGTAAKVNVFGQLSATVTGSVTANPPSVRASRV